MHVEIEAKLKVDSLEVVERRLAERGATLATETVQTDAYFDTADRALTQGDRCLRLRSERGGEAPRHIVTYKGARETDDFKKRREINLEVSDPKGAEQLFLALGYEKALVFDKRRHTWHVDGCEVALDELPLIGAFVEIEGPDANRIAQVRHMLALADAPHVNESYASLIAERLTQLGLAQTEIYL
jgi:adenylate cyclase class 2